MKLRDYKRRLNLWVRRYQTSCDLLQTALDVGLQGTEVVYREDAPIAEAWYLTRETLVLKARIERMVQAIDSMWRENSNGLTPRIRRKIQRHEPMLHEHRQALASLVSTVWERWLGELREREENARTILAAANGRQMEAVRPLFYYLIELEEVHLFHTMCRQMDLPCPLNSIEFPITLPERVQKRLAWHLRHYRIANLLVSWQVAQWNHGAQNLGFLWLKNLPRSPYSLDAGRSEQ